MFLKNIVYVEKRGNVMSNIHRFVFGRLDIICKKDVSALIQPVHEEIFTGRYGYYPTFGKITKRFCFVTNL